MLTGEGCGKKGVWAFGKNEPDRIERDLEHCTLTIIKKILRYNTTKIGVNKRNIQMQIQEELAKNSLAAALAAIEIYNKPYFQYREQTFTVLMINAWELLLKAKIVKDNEGTIESIYQIDRRTSGYKTNASGEFMTIGINEALGKLNLPNAVKDNIQSFIALRNTAVHCYHSESLSYVVFTLAVATLQNFHKLILHWFEINLSSYHFYILPLGFEYGFKSFSIADPSNEPEHISEFIKSSLSINSKYSEDTEYFFMCKIETQLQAVSTIIKKATSDTTEQTDLIVSITEDRNETQAIIIQESVEDFISYPYSLKDLFAWIKGRRPQTKDTEIQKVINETHIKGDKKYTKLRFKNKKQLEEFNNTRQIPKYTQIIYNDDAARLILTRLNDSNLSTSQLIDQIRN